MKTLFVLYLMEPSSLIKLKLQPLSFKQYVYQKIALMDCTSQVVTPHQPRLDWQMWFAALGSYNYNPWIINLAYRLLNNNSTDVNNLIKHDPFPEKPPKFIRLELRNLDAIFFRSFKDGNVHID